MDIKLAQGVAAGIATGDTDPADPGLLKQRAKDEALLPGDHFAGFALIDAQFADPVHGLLDNRVVRTECGEKQWVPALAEMHQRLSDRLVAFVFRGRLVDQAVRIECNAAEAVR